MPTPPRPPRAARPTPSPTPGACRAPGSKANTPISPPTPRACCWRAAISSTTWSRRPRSTTRGSRAAVRCSLPTPAISRPRPSRASRRWLAGGDRRLIVTGKTNLPPRLLGLHVLRPRAGAGLHRLALAAGLALRRRRLGGALRQRLQGPSGAPHRAGHGQPRARRPGRAVGRSQRRHDGHGERAGPGDRAHRPDGLRRQPGVRADRRHDAGPSQRRGGAPLGQRHALGRHAAVLPAPTDARGRPERRCGRPGCARSAPTTACCRSATTSTACATTPSSTTRSRT